ncbi:MAG: PD40 domain-containing protein [Gemmatimonadota bacterium]|nr:MAG: PD40 domain-containing protein [Gemmatimonadota bacterium]
MRRYMVLMLLTLVAIALPTALHAQGTRLLREPTVSETQIAFAYANDLWVVPRTGGTATRLTAFQGSESDPQFSPDGRWVAFSGEYDGNTDVFVVSAEGGEPMRLTWHPAPDVVVGWMPDGSRVIFASGRVGAPVPYTKLWTVSVEGGMPEPLPLPQAVTGAPSPDGTRFAYQRVARPNDQWRNYRGGRTQPVLLMSLADYGVEALPWDNSNDYDPVWLGNTVYFLSDRDWAVNLYGYDTESGTLEQLTSFVDYDVKDVDAGGGVVVFEQAGQIHLYDPAAGESHPVDIRVRGDFPWLRPHYERVDSVLRMAALSPSGARAVFEARGEIITVPAEKGDHRNLTQSPGAADRSPSWSADGQHIAWFSDASGEYRLMIGSQDGLAPVREIALPNPTFYYTPAWSPDSKYIVFTDADLNLWYADVERGQVTRIDTDQYAHPERTIDPVWSPDSKWIAYSKRLDNQFHAVMVYSLDQRQSRQLTDGLSDALSPAWDKSGKYLYFMASTNYGLNVGWLDMTSYDRPIERGLYLTVLAADEPSPLLPESDEEEPKAEEEEEEEEAAEDSAVRIDFAGIDQRILALDVPLANYLGIMAGPEGVLFYAENIDDQPGFKLHRYDLEKRESKLFMPRVQSATISEDAKKLLYRMGVQWGIVDTDAGEKKPGDGKINTAIQVRVDPRAEWRQMFREAWRHQRDYLYVENTHGADWDAVWGAYAPWLEHVAHRSDFTYLLRNMAGELSIGHSYTFGGDFPDVDRVAVGLLGADVAVERGRYRITRIYTGENWNPDLRAPLSAPGIDVAEGDYILAVNGVAVPGDANFYRFFEATANRQTTLTVNSSPSMDGARHVTVVPVTSEVQLRRRAWVEGNRRKVDELSGGRLAYVWLPNTGGSGYEYFNRYYFAQQHKEGAVVDERFNGGGSAADYMVDLMGRRLTGFFNNPIGERKPWRNPNAAIYGPKVMIINEYAGSGGDLLPYMFRASEIGPLVGTRTWGGLVGIWDVPPLMDGGMITAPRGGFYDLNGEWAVENEGVAPDIEVEQTPSQVIAGGDPQLERAVQEAMRLLETQAVEILPEPAAPVRARRPERQRTN